MDSPLRVLVAGGGFAAAEALLALRALAGDRVVLELVAPEERFAFRPASSAAPFTGARVETFSLETLARDTGAKLVGDRLEAVAPDVKRVRLASGAQRPYDVLILALGARARAAVPGAVTFRDQRDAAQLEHVVAELRRGELERLAVVVPPGVTWPLPAYELALLAAGEGAQVTLVTPERLPLEVFGTRASDAVSDALADRGVRLMSRTLPRHVDSRGLRLADGGTVEADRVVALPALIGRRVAGVPADYGGFVADTPPDVHAIGDMSSFPVKQGGLATQQADAVAALIARRAGAAAPAAQPPLVLRAQLFGAPEPVFIQSRLGPDGAPIDHTSQATSEAPWWPRGTLFGRHLVPWMAEQALVAA